MTWKILDEYSWNNYPFLQYKVPGEHEWTMTCEKPGYFEIQVDTGIVDADDGERIYREVQIPESVIWALLTARAKRTIR